MKKPNDGLGKLASLMGGGGAPVPSRSMGVDEAGDDEKLVEDAQKVLDLVNKLAGDNLFDMQTLLEFCADELRASIRESIEGEP
jgi:hypothetical protein